MIRLKYLIIYGVFLLVVEYFVFVGLVFIEVVFIELFDVAYHRLHLDSLLTINTFASILTVRAFFYGLMWLVVNYRLYRMRKRNIFNLKAMLINSSLYIVNSLILAALIPGAVNFFYSHIFPNFVIATFLSPGIVYRIPFLRIIVQDGIIEENNTKKGNG